ncbi:hypothetical protein DV735_g1145, partial [Chaetothyriales sp. CBS 134920]
MDELPRFRAPKRRKVNKLAVSDDGLSGDDSPQAQRAGAEDDQSVRIRTLRRPVSLRKGGVSFTAATATPSQQHPPGDLSLVLADDPPSDDTAQRPNRFVPPTGQLVDVDRHMTAYIDSRLSRHKPGTGDDNQQEERHLITQDRCRERHNDQKKVQIDRQSLSTSAPTRSATVMHGNSASSVQAYLLSEVAIPKIDPGTDAAAVPGSAPGDSLATAPAAAAGTGTAPLTASASQGKGNAATRRLKSGRVKPRRPRQRPEQDMARDALVEKLLAEHAPGGHYSAGANPIAGAAVDPGKEPEREEKEDRAGKGKGRESDEAFAARFRAAFFDPDKDKVKTSHGPKLGGSRSDKAKLAMIIAKKQQRAAAAGK